MVDVGRLFALGKGLAAEAIRTAGTEVTLTSESTSTTDPDTLERTETPGEVVSARAIVGRVQSSQTGELLPGVVVRAGDLRVTLLPAVTTPDPGVVVEITRCRDAQLVGQKATVIGTGRDSAGAVLTVYARPVRPT